MVGSHVGDSETAATALFPAGETLLASVFCHVPPKVIFVGAFLSAVRAHVYIVAVVLVVSVILQGLYGEEVVSTLITFVVLDSCVQHHVQLKALLPFQLLSTLSTCEVLLSVVTQHMLLDLILVKTQLTKLTLLFDISAPIVFVLNAMGCKLMFHQQILIGKCQAAARGPAVLNFLNSVDSEVELKVWHG